ncbi:MAG: sigma-70 family RNA polymerase sigma factor [Lachnospiraceae bacterium]|nr:sigma-70 family RNA polymerase sigma factor [Lachnospiraceae bacterium]
MEKDQCKATDEELVCRYNEGDREALQELLERHKKTVRKIISVNNFFILGGDSDDIIQEGMIGLVYAIRSFDGEKGVKFVTHASRCIKNHIIDAIRRDRAEKNLVLNQALPLDESGDDNLRGMDSVEDTVLNNEKADKLDAIIKQSLSPLEKEVYEMYIKGMKYGEISKALGKEKKTVDNATQRLREKIRRILDGMIANET